MFNSLTISFLANSELTISLSQIRTEISIKSLAELISEIVGFNGNLIFDSSMPDGNPRKLLDSTLINKLGWSAKTSLEKGLKLTYNWYVKNIT